MITRAFYLMMGCLGVLIGIAPSAAQSPPTAEQIIERLKSGQEGRAREGQRSVTRGFSAPAAPAPSSDPVPPTAAQRFFVEPRRGLSVGERNEVAAIAQVRPTIDLTIYFDFNSAEIGPKAVPTLVELGRALTSDALKGTRFLLAGHTDAKGGDAYNLRLSQRRADAIKRYLVTQFKVDEQRLLAIGYGKEQPTNTANPLADENRRVQVVNFGS